jgi:hypothetical protein
MAAGIAALKATAQNNVLGWNLMVCSCFIGNVLLCLIGDGEIKF